MSETPNPSGIAIVGMACRVAKAPDPIALWRLLTAGLEAIGEYPTDRAPWREDADTGHRRGGFLNEVGAFDSSFFGLSPREAAACDPQQLLALELCWESLEDAALLAGPAPVHSVGVFLGVSSTEYAELVGAAGVNGVERHSLTGVNRGVIANRVSRFFKSTGPSLTVDTAQSSSLVALHLACQALRRGECDVALAGGINLILSPLSTLRVGEFGALSPDGRSYTFDARANGFVRGEGGGVVVLRRVDQALRAGNRIRAVVRGSAVNTGTGDAGLTVPSPEAQESVIRAALSNAGVNPLEVSFVELHGPGTPVGDPIEAAALGAVYGSGRARETPLAVGSIKTNIGHLDAAAGILGLIKTTLCLEHRKMVPSLNFCEPNPRIALDDLRLRVLTQEEPLTGDEVTASVSSFGMGGVNCHVVLSTAPPSMAEGQLTSFRGPLAWSLSAKSKDALQGQAKRLRAHLAERPELEDLDVAYSLATGRARLEHRAVAVGGDRDALLAGLDALAAAEPTPRVVAGRAGGGEKVAFTFPGQGSQWPGMAVELLESSATFAERLAACGRALSAYLDWSLEDVLRGTPGAPALERVDVVQPALFAVMVSLAELWRSYGVNPSVVIGHSQGEIAAACVAGGLSLDDAARVVALRSQALGELAGSGGMVSLAVSADEVDQLIAGWEGRISVAAFNGPSTTVVSGEPEALDDLLATCEREGVRARRIPVNYASHSVQVEGIRDRLLESLAPIQPRTSEVPFFSAANGELIDTAVLDAEYWYRSLREPVLFAQAAQALVRDGVETFIEISPHPVLTIAVQDTIEHESPNGGARVIGSLRRSEGGWERFLLSLGEAFVDGVELDWDAVFADRGARRVELPTYAFEREQLWISPRAARGDIAAAGLAAMGHPLLSAAVPLAGQDAWIFTGRVSLETHAWLADHTLLGVVPLPSTVFVELVLRAGGQVGCERIDELTLETPLVLPDRGAVQLQVTVGEPDAEGRRQIAVYSRAAAAGDRVEAEWTRHAQGVIAAAAPIEESALDAWPPAGAEALDLDHAYDRLAELGFSHGPAFEGLRQAWRLGDELFCEAVLADELANDEFVLHPALLDAVVRAAVLAGSDGARLPISWSGVRVEVGAARLLRARLRLDGDAIALSATDADGAPVLAVERLLTSPVDVAQLRDLARGVSQDALFRIEWVQVNGASIGSAGLRVVVLGDADSGGLEDAVRYRDLAALAVALADGTPAPDAVLATIDAGDTTHETVSAAVALLQAWLAEERLADARLVLVTRAAVAVDDGELPAVAGAAVWGLVRCAQSEHPGRFVLADLDGDERSLNALSTALQADEPQLAVRAGEVFAPRLTRALTPDSPAATINGEGTVLVTGGTGALGGVLARHLAGQGAEHLLLVSRSGVEGEGVAELVAELGGLGAQVQVEACDVSDRGALERLLDSIPAERPLTAVIHAAGVLDDALIESLGEGQIGRVLAPKLDAAVWLDELTERLELSEFVVFSSAAGVFGTAGQGNYAAANAALDALVARRRARGLPAKSLAWGLWAGASGMGAQLSEQDVERLRRTGMIPLDTDQALALFDTARAASEAVVLPVALELSRWRASERVPPLLRGLVRAPTRRRHAAAGGSLAGRLAGVADGEREGVVLELVRGHAAAVLGHGSQEVIEPGVAFKEVGFDSLAAVELRNRLEEATGLRLPTTLVFDYPNPAAVTSYLISEVQGTARGGGVAVRALARPREPVAIVGMACRYPGGVESAAGLWRLVESGGDAISGFPTDRGWDLERLYDPDPDHHGTCYTREGGFVPGVGEFDAGFFGISPREALAMDPQQRLVLEVAWEALEHAGIDPVSLRGSETGVFAGATSQDYGLGGGELEGLRLTGNATSVVSGRVAYSLGLEGPAVTVDTACSSSLVALHLACQALRQGECGLALAGGVTVLSSPSLFVEFARQRGLAPDGRCKSFAGAADGTGWSEGVGLVVLERLSDAERNGHRVLGLVRGSAMNQDGASNGLTAPKGPSQERVIRQALANAGLSSEEIDAVEAHGTGTRLGDPIEAQALLATYGQDRSEPLWLGSIKSNIGHTIAAAGVAGVIKMIEALGHQTLPRTLHVDQPSPHVDWDAGQVQLLTEPRAWARRDRPRRAAVSSFGISGTNAHLILEEPPATPPQPERPADTGVLPWLLSAKTDRALRAQAERLRSHVQANPDLEPVDVAFSLATGRAQLERRAVVVAPRGEELLAGLGALAAGEPAGAVLTGRVRPDGRVAFMFTGQGAQWPGMGAELYQFPVFAQALEEVCAELDPLLGRSLKELMSAVEGSPEAELLGQTEFTQAGLFALELGLFRLVQSVGVRPDFLIGHSIGELVAAHVAGVLSLGDACRLVAARGRLMGALPAGGAMLAVQASEDQVLETLEGFEERLAVAAINGPTAVVVSGEQAALVQWSERLRDDIKTRWLRVSHAFHSHLMEPMLDEFREVAAGLEFHQAEVAIVSNVSGELAGEELATPEYWVRHVREAVRFCDGVRALERAGVTRFLELGPDGVLTAMARTCLDTDDALVVSALRARRPGDEALMRFLAEMFVDGIGVDWAGLLAGRGRRRVVLPSYAFEHERLWLAPSAGAGDVTAAGLADAEHPLLGAAVRVAGEDAWLFTGRVGLATHSWLADHAVLDTVLLPGTAFVECVLRAGGEVGCERLDELLLEAPLVLVGEAAVQLQVSVAAPDEDGRRQVAVYSRSAHTDAGELEAEWTRHATGVLSAEPAQVNELGLDEWPPAGAEVIEVDYLYDRLAEAGFDYGPAFQVLRRAWRYGEELLCEVALADEQQHEGFEIHPALFDALLHPVALAGQEVRLPFSWSGVHLHSGDWRELRARVRLDGDAIALSATSADGAPVLAVERLATRPVDPAQLHITASGGQDALFAPEWAKLAAAPAASAATNGDGPGVDRVGLGVVVVGDADSGGLEDAVRYRDLAALAVALADDTPAPDVVFAPIEVGDATRETVSAAVALLQAWLAEERLADARLVLVSRGAVAVDDGELPAVAGAAVWGLVRSAQSEHPGRFVLADLDEHERSLDALSTALQADEPQLAVRAGEVFAPRLTRAVVEPLVARGESWRLGVERAGTLEGLALVGNDAALRPLGLGEVRVGVRAAGLNFRDVLVALGLYPGPVPALGGEGAGVVLEVGPGVSELTVGDRVMGLMSDAFAPVAVCDARLLARVPAGWSWAQAASVPIVFLTAYYALVDLAELQTGERVLVHAAAGGVGIAAVQLAKHLGAEVFATASEPKWGTVRALGVDERRLASSRTLEFREAFLETTGGEGVDVVLDALAGEFVDASLELLPRGGRFVEMGKTDIRDADHVAGEHPGVSYRAFDLGEAGPERIAAMLTEIVALFERGALQHAPITTYDVRDGQHAFRSLSQARHVGKLVLTVPQPPDPRGTVLVTGGTGALGGVLARHLAGQGAEHLLLVSRSGVEGEGVAELVAELGGLGAQVQVEACDVSDRGALERLLDSIPAERPLTAVIHAAGVLDDALIESLGEGQIGRVLAPKLDAAVWLDELTERLELSEFVVFSSAAGVFGTAGQGNYAAANAALDALVARRRARGLPAKSLAWGLWAGASGMGAQLSEQDVERLRRTGMIPLDTDQALALFDTARAASEAVVLPVALELSRWRASERVPPLLRGLVRAPTRRRHAAAGGSLAGRLAGVADGEREGVVLELVRGHAAAVLGHGSQEVIEPGVAFKEVGFDSLAAVELRNRLEEATGLRLPTTLVFDYPNPAAVTSYLISEVQGTARGGGVAVRALARPREPVAIVGMACRYPGGVESAAGLWRLVESGGDAISGFPTDRGWDLERLYDPDPDHHGTCYTREGGFVPGVGEFDAGFFGISPREALAMDPQQRLVLEVAWEALEHAGIDPVSLRGSETGVFAGATSQDYGLGGGELEGLRLTGNATSVVSGRVAYSLGLEGPAVTVDTACSSSLVALHLACQALRQGECGLALAGGVTVLSSPSLFVEFARQRGLAPDGRCKSFAGAADGTGWSEGVGLVVLERLSDAERNGHRVLGLVRGSAMNQDGASNGLTAPKGPSQERVIRQALANAGLSSEEIDAVEAHGTGTRLGDPIEAQALLATYGQDRSEPLWLGSIKSNIGHTIAAAGVAGVIKMIEALGHQTLPRTLHVDQPSPHVDWDAGQVQLLTEPRAWARRDRPRRAAVSSFGISGTNAHLILEEPPATPPQPERPADTGVLPWLLSAKTDRALRAQAERLRSHVQANPDLEPVDVAFSLATGRAQLERRAVVVAPRGEELLAGLGALAAGEPAGAVLTGRVRPDGRVAFMFTGQGAQWPGMGAELYQFPVFAQALEEVCAELDPLLGRSLKELMSAVEGSPEAELLGQTEFTQAGLFALELGLFRLVQSVGVRPDFLIGHSIGELVAAHVAGVLSLGDACRLVAARGRLMGALPAGGAMLAVQASEDQVLETLEGFEERLAVAAINGPTAVVVSGEQAALVQWSERLRDDIKTRWLRVSHAFHSHLMEPMLDEFREVAAGLEFHQAEVAIVSNVSGELAGEELATPEYWVRHVREAVRFCDGVRALERAGVTRFLELGPDGVLTAMARTCLDTDDALVVSALRARRPGDEALMRFLAEMFVDGIGVDWAGLLAGRGRRRVVLPSYAFEHERLWLAPSAGAGDVTAAGLADAEHPLLGAAVRVAGEDAWLFTGRVGLATHSWLADHAVLDTVLLPGTAFVECVLRAGGEVGCERLDELLLEAPLVLVGEAAVQLQVSVAAPDEDGRRQVAVYSRSAHTDAGELEAEWTRHATGVLSAEPAQVNELGLDEWPPAGAEVIEVDYLYDRLAEAGFDYGPAFQVLRRAWRYGEELLCEVALADEQQHEGFEIHPALFDALLHPVALAGQEVRLPFSWSGVHLHSGDWRELRARVRLDGDAIALSATSADGAPVLAVERLATRPVDPAQLHITASGGQDALFAPEWAKLAAAPAASAATNGDGPGVDRVGLGVVVVGDADSGGLEDAVRYRDLAALAVALADDTPAPDVVFAPIEVGDATRETVSAAVALLQAWLAEERLADARLVLVSRGAVAVDDGELPAVAGAAVWGLVRSAQSEHPGRFVLADLDEHERSLDALSTALQADEPQLAVRAGEVFAPRLTRAVVEPLVARGESWRLGVERAGTLEGLALVGNDAALRPLGLGEVRVGVRAAGLNFRDVLVALGLYPGPVPALGGEGAGVVLEVGPGVSELTVGDRVMGLMSDAFAPVAVCDARLLARVPAGWSWAQAASVPIVFLTAYYALVDLAELQTGERVLVHAAAGGVGIAAVQLAKHLGAEVFATASEPKWGTVRALGVDERRLASSRTLEFREAFLETTGGEGVDVVLDALAGEFVDASLELLPRGGRFVEMGKTDIRDADHVAGEHPGVSYRAFDLGEAGPERIAAMLTEIVALFERGALQHAPITTYDVRDGQHAFRSLSQARHVGKLVLTVPQPPDPRGTVLVTGGTGALGGVLARHLAGQGAEHLLLVSRSGVEGEGVAELVAELGGLGAQVQVEACDVSDRGALERLLDSIPAERPLTAVIHAAGVLDDALIESLGEGQIGRVLAPKLDAAVWLDELTERLELSEFVVFSSAAGVFGTAGQGNYAAANAALDALVARRRARGLPAKSLAWGLWAGASGMGAQLSEQDVERLRRTGMIPLDTDQALALFDTARAASEAVVLPVALELSRWRASERVPPLLRGLVRAPTRRRHAAAGGSLAGRLAGVADGEREGVVLELVRGHAAAVLGHGSQEVIEPGVAFKEVGFDSLAAVELRNRLEEATGLRLPTTLVFDYPNPAAVTSYLISEVQGTANQRDPIDQEFDNLERLLASLETDGHTEHTNIRLLSIVSRAQFLLNMAEDSEATSTDTDLKSTSSDEQLFALVEEELGT